MIELVTVFAGLVLLGGAALAVALLPPLSLLWGAAFIVAAGCLLGVPGGVLYHWALRRELLRRGTLARGWFWHPTRLHARLDDDARRRVWPWFVAGALGFLLIMLGAGLATLTLMTHFG